MLLYFVAFVIIMAVTIGDFFIFLYLGKKTLQMSGIKAEFAYIGSYLYLFCTWFAIFVLQGEFQKLIGSTVNYWPFVISPFIIGLFLGLLIFRKDISIVKNRKLKE